MIDEKIEKYINERFNYESDNYDCDNSTFDNYISSSEQIEELRKNLQRIHKCDDISYYFKKIEDSYDYVWIKFTLRTLSNGIMNNREIFSIKIKVSDEIKMRAKQLNDKK